MHPDIIASVIDAESIGASGRWKALEEKILSRGGTEAAKHWHLQLFSNYIVRPGKSGTQDWNLLPFAVDHDYAFVTNNRRDFLREYG
jgi:hypothetical protein